MFIVLSKTSKIEWVPTYNILYYIQAKVNRQISYN